MKDIVFLALSKKRVWLAVGVLVGQFSPKLGGIITVIGNALGA